MTRSRTMKWLAVAGLGLATLPLWLLAAITLFGANWARGPLQDLVQQRTGRALRIGGDLGLRWVDGRPRAVAAAVGFANPAWASAPMMLQADGVEIRVGWRALLQGRLELPEVRLSHPRIFLEQGTGGRKTWLLDLAQTQESHRLTIGRLQLDAGEIDYTDLGQSSTLHATLSTRATPASPGAGVRPGDEIVFQVQGRFRGQPLTAAGSGGSALAWRDESAPYPLTVKGTVGRTQVQAEGTVTSLRLWRAADLRVTVQGDSLASLFPYTGIVLPPTPAYQFAGRLVREAAVWRFESFNGHIGKSTLAGTLEVQSGGPRPALAGDLRFERLDLTDLRAAVGARSAEAVPPPGAADSARVLPSLPLDTSKWASLDADVALEAHTLVGGPALTFNDLKTHVALKDARLSLDPLAFGWAGGKVQGHLAVDAGQAPIQGTVALQLRGLSLGTLLAPVLRDASGGGVRMGLLDADAELQGHGASVGSMLASAKGRLSLRAQEGQISRLLMETSGLHLLEILRLNLVGDQPVAMNCAVAVFDVDQGLMRSSALLLDTAVNSLQGTGHISLASEQIDLTIVPRTKVNTLVALRGPVHIGGTFRKPEVKLDVGRIAARGAGAVALGLLNPLLAIIPLFEAGPGAKNDCHRLLLQAQGAAPAPKI